MKKKSLARLAVALWAILSIGNIIQFNRDLVEASDPLFVGELEERLFIETLAINAPISLVVAFGAPFQAPDLGAGPSGMVAIWCLLTFAGFVQWTILLPGAIRWAIARFAGIKKSES